LSARASGRLVWINVSNGGVPKTPVRSARVTADGVEGDRQRDLRHHGGPERAVSLYPLELIEALQAEGHPIGTGSIGENLTVRGLNWSLVVPGAHLLVGAEVVLRITRYASPCANIAAAFAGGDYARVSQTRYPGWSRVCACVRRPGVVTQDDPVRVITTAEADGLAAGSSTSVTRRREG